MSLRETLKDPSPLPRVHPRRTRHTHDPLQRRHPQRVQCVLVLPNPDRRTQRPSALDVPPDGTKGRPGVVGTGKKSQGPPRRLRRHVVGPPPVVVPRETVTTRGPRATVRVAPPPSVPYDEHDGVNPGSDGTVEVVPGRPYRGESVVAPRPVPTPGRRV